MYEKLIQDLRDKAEFLRKASCYSSTRNSFVETMSKAADAIEELSRLHEAQRQNLIALMNEEPEPKWIPVTDKEHIPNTDHGVVGYFGGGAFNQLRWYDFITTLSDGTIVGESTERDVINDHCIAVYKLPDPPKEE